MHTFDLDTRPSDSTLVDHVWGAHSDRPGSFISVARPTLMHFPSGAVWFGITLRLGAFPPDFPPLTLLDQRDATLPAATSQSFWLHGSAWPLPTFEN